jgi:NAD(P)-dependent dehydrogenase (short-subunit alcohol dehydrogenase family)
MSHDIIINLMGKIAVVTGGIGLAAARLSVAEGAHVVPGYSSYAATKAGVRAMTRNLAPEFTPE